MSSATSSPTPETEPPPTTSSSAPVRRRRRPHHHWSLEEKRFVYFYRSRDIYNLDQLRQELKDRFQLDVTHDALQKEWQRINKKRDPDVVREPFNEEWAVGRAQKGQP